MEFADLNHEQFSRMLMHQPSWILLPKSDPQHVRRSSVLHKFRCARVASKKSSDVPTISLLCSSFFGPAVTASGKNYAAVWQCGPWSHAATDSQSSSFEMTSLEKELKLTLNKQPIYVRCSTSSHNPFLDNIYGFIGFIHVSIEAGHGFNCSLKIKCQKILSTAVKSTTPIWLIWY